MKTPSMSFSLPGMVLAAPASAAALDFQAENPWLSWLVIGAVALFVVGVVLRMIFAARFPAGYRSWARNRRETFAARNEQWDNDDDAFRK